MEFNGGEKLNKNINMELTRNSTFGLLLNN